MAVHSHELKMYGEIKLFAGTASPDLAQKIAEYLQTTLCGRDIILFPTTTCSPNYTGVYAGRMCMSSRPRLHPSSGI